ncbi:MAG: hypothetical protein H0X26_01765 [Alphaproteobacteria bacterium]|nr:hypothetical protein [Alphaproteobacteria bacterium]
MNKRPFLFLACLTLLFPMTCEAAKNVAVEVTPAVGYRQDSLKWTANDKSSGQWKNIKFIEYGAKAKAVIKDRYVFNFDVMVGNLIGGSFQDNNYLNPLLASSVPAQKGSSLSFRPNFGIGYKFKPKRCFALVSQLGFFYELLYLKTKKVNSGPFSELKDTVQWFGPWIGLDTTTKLTQRLTLDLGGAYQLAFYRNSATWNTPFIQTQNRTNQKATGQGVAGRVRLQYEVVKSVSLGGEADIAWKWTNSGHSTRKFADTPTVKNTLTKVTARTWGARLVLTKAF